jgi:hypothetical protein
LSFIPYNISPYEKRAEIPADYKPRSFNEKRQYIDFVRRFIYPYKIPDAILFASLSEEYYTDENGKKEELQYARIIRLSRKWVCDIISGQSFFRRNSDYFTKAESHIFLNSEPPYTGENTVLETYFYAKCAARKIGIKNCRIISKVFAEKFLNHFDHPAVTGFIDLLSRDVSHRIEYGELGDICDFVLAKVITMQNNSGFTFSGRTLSSITTLANEWHAEIQQELKALAAIDADGRWSGNIRRTEKLRNITWRGLAIQDYKYKTDTFVWTVTQLRSVRQLLSEGLKMKNCVASYSAKCEKGLSHIFNVSCTLNDTAVSANSATLEVNAGRTLIQAKGKCNKNVSRETMSVIKRWGAVNRITVSGVKI